MSIGAYLDCDLCSYTCYATQAVNGFRQQLRDQARKDGWGRVREGDGWLDLCPRCLAKRETKGTRTSTNPTS